MKIGCVTVVLAAAIVVAAVVPGHTEDADPTPARGASGRPGLLVVAHGAPAEAPNRLVLEMKPLIARALGRESPFGAVEIAFLEFARPTVAEGVRSLEDAGCSRIVAVPLLIAPSDHSLLDVPALLGLYTDPERSRELLAAGAEIARPRVPVTVTPPLSRGDALLECLLERVRAISTDPGNEALVVCAHGSGLTEAEWDGLLRRAATFVCGKVGITYADWAQIQTGQGFLREGARAIRDAGRRRERVLVAGLYLVTGMEDIVERRGGPSGRGGGGNDLLEFLHGDRVVYTEKGLLPDARIASWVAHTATEAAALQAGTPGLEPIRILDEDRLLHLSVRDAAKYHGDLCACLACGFRATQLGIRELWGDEIPEREDIRVLSAHPAHGVRDAFEFVTRAATRGDLETAPPPGTSRKDMKPENWIFTFTRKSTGESVEIRVRESVFPGGARDFLALRRAAKFGENTGTELKEKFAAARDELRDSFLERPLEDLFEHEKREKSR